MTWKKKLLIGLVAATLLLLLTLALMPSPIPVSTSQVQQGYFAEVVEDEGRTRLREPFTVTAPIHGYLRRVTLEPGDAVLAGMPLFQMEPVPAPALDPRAREQAREAVFVAGARLEAARAEQEARATQYTLAQVEYERAEHLHQRDLVSSEERDRRRAQRDATRAAERAARHAVEVARFELASARLPLEIADGQRSGEEIAAITLEAPIDGIITRRHRRDEGPIQAGEAVLELGNLDDLEVQVDLLSLEAVRVRPGMRVVLERWGGGDELEARVRRVEPAGFEKVSALGVEEQRVWVWSRITSPREAWEHLGDGYRVEARFVLWEGDEVVHIPTSALFRDQDRWAVFVVEEGRARLRSVETGRRSGLRTQIESGLEPGEWVITHPGERVGDGVRVESQQ
ncbi:efflux RND transporter periplasmic adaptor subunit [Ectothiorhodospira sp. BSL-9]|uniref:efflux RND transporter periplasmic adaptor subunit n=1 Tax=Ectothiorhodospira sp. BSL-9 TaxID=1442136 RepID=UPI0007B44263|nr:HlyD family efflux transporter periplasmic adaptor subunit [Ectothiorhodospira sp. BSL-9]ANB02179.1 RND transporter [Ectothiorhodospira sp. BSL-9]